MDEYFKNIILIGPIRVGKSTIARLLSEKLGIPRCPMDQLRWKYYHEIGYDEQKVRMIGEQEGFLAVYNYWKVFEAYSVVRLLSEVEDCIIDFGAGHSVYEENELFIQVDEALKPFQHVILLLPSNDPEESIRILNERTGGFIRNGFDFHKHFVTHPSNYKLAKHIIYTKEKSPEEVCEEIIHHVKF